MFHLDRLIPIALLALGGVLFAASTAFAGPAAMKVHGGHHGGHHVAKRAYGHGHGHSHAAKHGNVCRTVFTFGRRGTVKQVICDDVSNRYAGPPAWTPAHGRKHRDAKRRHRPVVLAHPYSGWAENTAQAGRARVAPAWQVADGRYCREFIRTATIDGRLQQIYGRACLQPDGAWQTVD